MYYDTITIEPAVLDWWLLCIPFIVTGVLLTVALILDRRDYDAAAGRLLIIAVVALILSILFIMFAPRGLVEAGVKEHQRTALQEQLGFTNVTLTTSDGGNTFIASDADGMFVKGKLVEIGQDEYALVPLP